LSQGGGILKMKENTGTVIVRGGGRGVGVFGREMPRKTTEGRGEKERFRWWKESLTRGKLGKGQVSELKREKKKGRSGYARGRQRHKWVGGLVEGDSCFIRKRVALLRGEKVHWLERTGLCGSGEGGHLGKGGAVFAEIDYYTYPPEKKDKKPALGSKSGLPKESGTY